MCDHLHIGDNYSIQFQNSDWFLLLDCSYLIREPKYIALMTVADTRFDPTVSTIQPATSAIPIERDLNIITGPQILICNSSVNEICHCPPRKHSSELALTVVAART
jgi:hypothetical protein